MAKSITQDGITFSKVKTTTEEGILEVSAGIKVSQADGVDPNYGGIINAVDIDWNDAKIQLNGDSSDRTIQNTGELMQAIIDASNSGGSGGTTPNITATASVDSNTGTPTITVNRSGTSTNLNFEFVFENLKGDTGAQGSKGDKGDTGAQGPKGDKGDTGAQGPKGDKGDTGAQGPKGDKGDTGAQGPKGDKGDTGAQGPKGDKGDTGAQGPKGDKGDTGAQGPKGDKGDTGAQGPKGDKGDTGEQGPKGDTGTFDDSALKYYVKQVNGIPVDNANNNNVTIGAEKISCEYEEEDQSVQIAINDLYNKVQDLTNLVANIYANLNYAIPVNPNN